MIALNLKLALAAFCMLGFSAGAQAQSPANTTDTDTVHNTNTTNNPPVTNATVDQLTDSDIAHIVHTADEGEMSAAKLAKSRATNKEVKDFANMMLNEHKANDKENKSVAKKGKIKLKDNDISKNLKKETKDSLASLKKLKGADFDKAYITNQIAMHEQVLNDLESKLIPAAQNPELKSHLEMTKTHVQTHLAKAKDIEISISK